MSKIVQVVLYQKVRQCQHINVEVPDDFDMSPEAKSQLADDLYSQLADLDMDRDEDWQFDECTGMTHGEVNEMPASTNPAVRVLPCDPEGGPAEGFEFEAIEPVKTATITLTTADGKAVVITYRSNIPKSSQGNWVHASRECPLGEPDAETTSFKIVSSDGEESGGGGDGWRELEGTGKIEAVLDRALDDCLDQEELEKILAACEGCWPGPRGVRDFTDNGTTLTHLPEGWHIVERCDTCEKYADDLKAAEAVYGEVQLMDDTGVFFPASEWPEVPLGKGHISVIVRSGSVREARHGTAVWRAMLGNWEREMKALREKANPA